jgi:hypothetical protein
MWRCSFAIWATWGKPTCSAVAGRLCNWRRSRRPRFLSSVHAWVGVGG